MNSTRRCVVASLALAGIVGFVDLAAAKGKAHHNNGSKLLGGKIKTNGKHVLEKRGPHTVSVDVKDGKIAGLQVKHATKGELPVTKYKTAKKMAAAGGIYRASYMQVQDQYLGTTYIGFAYYDEYGDEYIYWYPYDMILDGDTGAIEYIPAY
jgi:hypothetical protein